MYEKTKNKLFNVVSQSLTDEKPKIEKTETT